MSAQDPQGNQKYWFNGLPFSALTSNGSVKYWFNGTPVSSLNNGGAALGGFTVSYQIGQSIILDQVS